MIYTLSAVQSLGKAKVIVDIVAKGNKEIRPEYPLDPSFVTIHNTGNIGRGANADMHNRYIHNMANKSPLQTSHVSWHFSVDESAIYQHLPLNEAAYHCGDGIGLTSGNRTSIGIEICEHVDQKDYAQAEENAIALTEWLLKNCSIPVVNVKPHQHWSGKYCPRVILKRDGSFDKFHDRIKAACVIKPVITPVANTVTPKSHTVVKGDTFSSIARGYGLSAAYVADCNPRVVPTDLQVGDVIHLIPVVLPKPIVKPVVKPKRVVGQGVVIGDVWTQESSAYSSKGRVKIVKKGQIYKAYSQEGDYICLGKEWIHKNYFKITKRFSN